MRFVLLLKILDKYYRLCLFCFTAATVSICFVTAPVYGVSKKLPPKAIPSALKETTQADSVIEKACEKIVVGDFEAAARLLEDSGAIESTGLEQLERIIKEYEVVHSRRTESQSRGYLEQIKELEELRLDKPDPNDVPAVADSGDQDTPEETIPADDRESKELKTFEEVAEKYKDPAKLTARQVSDIFTVAVKALEYTDESRKQELLEHPFLTQTIERALVLAGELEANGEWVDAYAYSYYWLAILFEDNKDYKNHGEELTELAVIEMSLMDNSCETSIERYGGINKNMVIKAVKALDFNYISVMDYSEMAMDGLKRCQLLGRVLEKSKKEMAFKSETDKVRNWEVGLDIIHDELRSSTALITMRKFFWVFENILDLNDKTIELPREIVIAQFARASFESLDPYTSLVWPWEVKDFQKNMTNQFTGIGIRISKVRGVLTAVSLIPNTPAYSSGLDADDSILAINGESTEDMTMNCAVSKITGPQGTDVTLTIKSTGAEETEDIVITRARIIVPTIQGWQRADAGTWRHMLDSPNKIGYIRITGFSETTAPDMEKVLDDLESRGLNGLVIDLRFNSGGYLSTAAKIVDMFVDEGLIVRSQPRWGVSTYEQAHRSRTHSDFPIVVLINGTSASASEIVAGALQDAKYKRATIVGERSYGKGSVQTITSFSGDGSQLKYTMAYYHLPSDQRVKNRYIMKKLNRKDWGITPDVEVSVKLRTAEGQKMLKVQGANEILAKADHDDSSKPIKRYSASETIDADPQLAVGLLVLKSKIIRLGGNIKFDSEPQVSINDTAPANGG